MNNSMFQTSLGLPLANVYGSSYGRTLGNMGSSGSPYGAGNKAVSDAKSIPTETDNTDVQNAVAVANSGNPFTWWLILAGLFAAAMLVAQYFGEDSEFSNVKASFYNVVIITLCAIVGLSMAKFIATRWSVPGLSSIILNL